MKTKLKIIIPTSIAFILIAFIVIFNIPYNLNNALRFDDSEWIIMSVTTMKNVGGRAEADAEDFTFEKGSIEFRTINELLDKYSFNITIAKDINKKVNGNMATITILDNNNSGLFLINSTGANITINGVNHQMKQNKIEELIDEILDICGMQ